jgi:hypothetical protein
MTNALETAAHIALLAPVPEEHLIDGQHVAKATGRVAFGSRAWEVFRKLDTLRKGMPVDVYIYASHTAGKDPEFGVSWRARYIRHVESVGGAHPDGMRYRPPSTASYPSDNCGYWAVFWEVEGLHPLPKEEHMSPGVFTGFEKQKRYRHAFPPEGPILIEHP